MHCTCIFDNIKSEFKLIIIGNLLLYLFVDIGRMIAPGALLSVF